jgi:hypothetical protein
MAVWVNQRLLDEHGWHYDGSIPTEIMRLMRDYLELIYLIIALPQVLFMDSVA